MRNPADNSGVLPHTKFQSAGHYLRAISHCLRESIIGYNEARFEQDYYLPLVLNAESRTAASLEAIADEGERLKREQDARIADLQLRASQYAHRVEALVTGVAGMRGERDAALERATNAERTVATVLADNERRKRTKQELEQLRVERDAAVKEVRSMREQRDAALATAQFVNLDDGLGFRPIKQALETMTIYRDQWRRNYADAQKERDRALERAKDAEQDVLALLNKVDSAMYRGNEAEQRGAGLPLEERLTLWAEAREALGLSSRVLRDAAAFVTKVKSLS